MTNHIYKRLCHSERSEESIRSFTLANQLTRFSLSRLTCPLFRFEVNSAKTPAPLSAAGEERVGERSKTG